MSGAIVLYVLFLTFGVGGFVCLALGQHDTRDGGDWDWSGWDLIAVGSFVFAGLFLWAGLSAGAESDAAARPASPVEETGR